MAAAEEEKGRISALDFVVNRFASFEIKGSHLHWEGIGDRLL